MVKFAIGTMTKTKILYDPELTRDDTLALRGIAITMVMLHNFCHWIPGTVHENQSEFSVENTLLFFSRLQERSGSLPFDICSYLFWYGMPVFIFLTGYGLVRKYESGPQCCPLSAKKFIISNYLKLFRLLLPAVIILCVSSIIIGFVDSAPPFRAIAGHVLMLTFINDLLFNIIPPDPVVYWYLGITLQFYLLYAVAVHRKPLWMLLTIAVISITCQALLIPSDSDGSSTEILRWIRYNFPGWTATFAFGIIYARKARKVRRTTAVAVLAAAVILFFPAMFNEFAWQLTPICGIVIVIATMKLFSLSMTLRKLWIWVGVLSPAVYIVHPLLRGWIYRWSDPGATPWTALLLFIPAVIAGALLYRMAVNFFGTATGKVRSDA